MKQPSMTKCVFVEIYIMHNYVMLPNRYSYSATRHVVPKSSEISTVEIASLVTVPLH